eukprot:m.198503 g.198503  ORF g.198503 m.198503 type:complete len:229 (+) comp14922_c0_seq12:219-905(+)
MAEQASESEDIGVVDVLIIGGGASGLAAAKKLSSTDLSYIVLEADSRLGGRIRPLSGFADGLGLEAGANYLHGFGSVLYKHAQEQGFDLPPTEFPDKLLLPPEYRQQFKSQLVYTFIHLRVMLPLKLPLWRRCVIGWTISGNEENSLWITPQSQSTNHFRHTLLRVVQVMTCWLPSTQYYVEIETQALMFLRWTLCVLQRVVGSTRMMPFLFQVYQNVFHTLENTLTN